MGYLSVARSNVCTATMLKASYESGIVWTADYCLFSRTMTAKVVINEDFPGKRFNSLLTTGSKFLPRPHEAALAK